MAASLAVGLPRDIQPMRATLVGACAATTRGASTAPRAIMRRTVTCLGFMVTSSSVFIADAERQVSAAGNGRSEARAEAIPSRLQTLVRPHTGAWVRNGS